jgi:nucleoside-diphosphate-sugar epimerase
MDINSKIYIAGHRGMVGSAIQRNLLKEDSLTLLLALQKN